MGKMKKGFTLAETLITLGIIGVVAAITIPGLIETYQKQATVNKLKKAISILNQAYKLSFDDVGEPDATIQSEMTSTEYFNTYWAPYIKVITMCSTYKVCGYTTPTPWTNTNGNKNSWFVVEPRLRTTFMTPDGFVYIPLYQTWKNNAGEEKKNLYDVIVDINNGELPNKLGRDVFFLTRVTTDGGGIRCLGYDKSDEEINQNCSKSGTGDYCAEKIRRAGWKIQKDYPWK